MAIACSSERHLFTVSLRRNPPTYRYQRRTLSTYVLYLIFMGVVRRKRLQRNDSPSLIISDLPGIPSE